MLRFQPGLGGGASCWIAAAAASRHSAIANEVSTNPCGFTSPAFDTFRRRSSSRSIPRRSASSSICDSTANVDSGLP